MIVGWLLLTGFVIGLMVLLHFAGASGGAEQPRPHCCAAPPEEATGGRR